MDIHKAFRIGAQRIAANECEYTTLHKSHGLELSDWELLIQKEYWSADQAKKIRSILAAAVEVSLTIANIPPGPLPGQYVAAVIAEIVAPPNRMVACHKAPDTFDAASALEEQDMINVKPVNVYKLQALVLLYSGEYDNEYPPDRLPREIGEQMKEEKKVN